MIAEHELIIAKQSGDEKAGGKSQKKMTQLDKDRQELEELNKLDDHQKMVLTNSPRMRNIVQREVKDRAY